MVDVLACPCMYSHEPLRLIGSWKKKSLQKRADTARACATSIFQVEAEEHVIRPLALDLMSTEFPVDHRPGSRYMSFFAAHGDVTSDTRRQSFLEFTGRAAPLRLGLALDAALHRVKSIQDNAESFGVSCSLTYDDLHRASVGFSRNLQFDLKTAFSCPKHV